jgi:hypothetical protein
MSSRTIIGLLVGLSTAIAACSSEPTNSPPRIGNTSGGSGDTSGAGTGTTVGTGNTSGTSDPSEQGGTTSAGGTGDGTSGSTTIAGSTGVAGTGTVTMTDPCIPLDSVKTLPMPVDTPFIPGGYFVDPTLAANVTGIVHAACDSRPTDVATHYGSCHKWSFLPSMLGLDPVTMTMKTYGGVFWLAGSATNWGTGPGANVMSGAQTVKFRAWGASGGEVVTFSVGGVTGTTCLDSVNFGTTGGMKVTLTTTPTDYVFNLQGQTYPKGVIGGFSWSTENASTTVPVVFNVDDIRWTADAT